jgi:hypothetical protein
MTTTIVLGVPRTDCSDCELAFQRLERAAAQYGFLAERGVSAAEVDCQMGLKEIEHRFDLAVVAVIRAPRDCPAPLAPEIQESFVEWEMSGKKPLFFEFLRDVASSLKGVSRSILVAFSGEWESGDRVRRRDGTMDELVEFLKRPGAWYQRLYVPRTGRWQDSDDIPLIFLVDVG